MRLLTLVAGYAAGLAVAMKYRKEAGTSKVKKSHKKSTVDSIIDEIVDIHKTAYADIKSSVTTMWEDVDSLDALKTKVMTVVDDFSQEVETRIAELRVDGAVKKEEAEEFLDSALAEKESVLDSAREKALSFADGAHETVDTFLADARKKLTNTHKKLKTKLEKDSTEETKA